MPEPGAAHAPGLARQENAGIPRHEGQAPVGMGISSRRLRNPREAESSPPLVGRACGTAPAPGLLLAPAMTRILVLYGSTHGQTAQIAEAVADAMRAQGAEVDLADAATRNPAPDAYAAVVVAASVHAGGYQRPVQRWVRGHTEALRDRASAFVSVCLGVLQHDPGVDRELGLIRDLFLAATGWKPSIIKVVAGALPYTKYNWIKRWIMRRIVRKAGGDTDTEPRLRIHRLGRCPALRTRLRRAGAEHVPRGRGAAIVSLLMRTPSGHLDEPKARCAAPGGRSMAATPSRPVPSPQRRTSNTGANRAARPAR